MGTPIALVGIIIMAVNTGTVTGTGTGTGGEKGTGIGSRKGTEAGTGLGVRAGKEYTSHQLSSTGSNSDSNTTPHPSQTIIKIITNNRKDKEKDKMSDSRINQNTDSNISISMKKEYEQCVDQSMAETGRSRRHLGGMF